MAVDKKTVICLLLILNFAFLPLGTAFAKQLKPSGPIPLTYQHPFYVYFLNPIPDAVETLPAKKLSFDFRHTMANNNVRQYSYPPARDRERVELDMEIHKFDFDFRYSLNERMQIQLDIPYLISWAGFLDSMVVFFEDILGATAPSAREDWGMNDYRYFLRYNGQTLIDRADTVDGFGDICAYFKYKLIEEDERLPSLAARIGLKFPTGSDDDLLGSGEFDYSLGLAAQKQIRKVFLYLNFDTVFIETPGFLEAMVLDDYMLSGFFGMEYFLNPKLSLLLQGGFMTSPYPGVKDVTSLENPPVHIGFGCNWRLNEKSELKTSVIQNGSSASADITLQVSIKSKF